MTSYRYEVFAAEGVWWAQVHCDCGTTVTARGVTANEAMQESGEGFREHRATAGGPKCGTTNHHSARCFCDQCRRHGRELAEAVDTINRKRPVDAPAPDDHRTDAAQIAAWPHMVVR